MEKKIQKTCFFIFFILITFGIAGCGPSSPSKTVNLNNDSTVLEEGNNQKEDSATDKGAVKLDADNQAKNEEVSNELTDAQAGEKESNTIVSRTNIAQRNESNNSDFKIINRPVSWGYEESSSRKIDTIIIHSTYNAIGGDEFDLEKIIDIYKSYGVAPHYIVSRDAKIYRLVADKNIAYHAGESKMSDGRTGVNKFSIGIEMINSKTQGPNDGQYEALKKLLGNLKSQYPIKYVLGHSDIAPGRKDDPWAFDWRRIK